jgi:hypothetical protein
MQLTKFKDDTEWAASMKNIKLLSITFYEDLPKVVVEVEVSVDQAMLT